MKKRVWCLYRVSDEKQSDSRDDIPMQRIAAHNFIEQHKDWAFDREFVEVDVSGFKLKASQRNKLVEIMEGANNKQFEILLVFMFDRIGRKWDDTPQVVEQIVESGVEVWSVNEGQMKFENHTDRLINYITFWQAGGESLKTSVRVKEKMSQLNKEGRYMGGTPNYGYEMYDSGEFKKDKNGKKIRELKGIRICESEAIVVKIIYDLVKEKGYGGTRIAKYLNSKGYKTRSGKLWRDNYILRILRNPIYMGYKPYGVVVDTKDVRLHMDKIKLQPFNPLYVIIPKDEWVLVQDVLDGRRSLGVKNNNIPLKSLLLFSGIAKCGYCGNKLRTDYSLKYHTKKNGTISKYKVLRYVCGHKKSAYTGIKHECTQFGAKKYEDKVMSIINEKIKQIDLKSFEKIYIKNKENTIQNLKAELNKNKKDLSEKEKEEKGLQSLRIKVEIGQSNLSAQYVEEMMLNCKNDITLIKKQISNVELEIEKNKCISKEMMDFKNILLHWDSKIDIDQKKVILSKIIKELSFAKNNIKLEMIDIFSGTS